MRKQSGSQDIIWAAMGSSLVRHRIKIAASISVKPRPDPPACPADHPDPWPIKFYYTLDTRSLVSSLQGGVRP